MSQENVEVVRRAYEEVNARLGAAAPASHGKLEPLAAGDRVHRVQRTEGRRECPNATNTCQAWSLNATDTSRASLATVDTTHPEPEAAVAFYGGLFGWEFEDVMPPESERRYFVARLRGLDVAAVGSIPEGAPPIAMWNTYFWVDSADETASKVPNAGGGVIAKPVDVPPDAGRTAAFTDPEGAAFRVWQAKENKGAQLVNQPGSWNLNGLNTRDVEGAKSFYGSVFGWRTITLGGGAEMWTQPGFGDFLERDNPDLRKQMEAADAPKGFEDVVGTINPIPDEQPDTPAHWSVTFAVADADATAAKATELGGKVIVPPFDAPWVRMTVLADPQGATFIASKFAPENKDLGG